MSIRDTGELMLTFGVRGIKPRIEKDSEGWYVLWLDRNYLDWSRSHSDDRTFSGALDIVTLWYRTGGYVNG